jgi:predicted nucleic acid-binding protein
MIGLDTCAIIDLLDNKIAGDILNEHYAISVLVKYEFLIGASLEETKLFDQLWQKAHQINLDEEIVNAALKSQIIARKKGSQIPFTDCLIGTSYALNNIPILTINKKDFKEILDLAIIPY